MLVFRPGSMNLQAPNRLLLLSLRLFWLLAPSISMANQTSVLGHQIHKLLSCLLSGHFGGFHFDRGRSMADQNHSW